MRLSAINNLEDGGLKMIDIESLVKALRLAWLKRIFSDNKGTWKSHLLYLLHDVDGLLIFKYNYSMKDLSVNSVFYRELLEWWSEFSLLSSKNLFLDHKERLYNLEQQKNKNKWKTGF